MKKTYQQQGDVLIGMVDKIPSDAKPIDSNILQHGELTGHAHRLFGEAGDFQVLEQPDKTKWLMVNRAVNLAHEEHKTQTIEKGAYRIGIVVENDPFEKMTRRVLD